MVVCTKEATAEENPRRRKAAARWNSTLAVDALWNHRRLMLVAGWGLDGFVFRNSRGGPLRRSHFHADNFKPLLKKAGLPKIRFPELRHTAASLMLAGGEHPNIEQEIHGHSQIGITMDIYLHRASDDATGGRRSARNAVEYRGGLNLAEVLL